MNVAAITSCSTGTNFPSVHAGELHLILRHYSTMETNPDTGSKCRYFEDGSCFFLSEGNAKPPGHDFKVAASFDDGGIQSVVAGAIIMKRIEEMMHQAGKTDFHVLKHFHMLGGSGTGGLLALLLGRLGASPGRIIEFYNDLSKQCRVGSDRGISWWWGWKAKGGTLTNEELAEKLDEFVNGLSSSRAKTESTDVRVSQRPFYHKGDDALSVFVVIPGDVEGPNGFLPMYRKACIVRPYDKEVQATVGDVAKATSVSFTLRPLYRLKALDCLCDDGVLEFSNPSEILIDEAETFLGYGLRFGLLLSIGTTSRGRRTPEHTTQDARDRRERLYEKTGRTHDEVRHIMKISKRGTYVRTNVPGLYTFAQDDYTAIPEIIKRTTEFLGSDIGVRQMNATIEALIDSIEQTDLEKEQAKGA